MLIPKLTFLIISTFQHRLETRRRHEKVFYFNSSLFLQIETVKTTADKTEIE